MNDATQFFNGAAGDGVLNIEDVFSTYLYTGTGSTQTITNGINLAGKGGMVWIKNRKASVAYGINHVLFDTTRGAGNQLSSDQTYANAYRSDTLTSFSGTGFSLGADFFEATNTDTYTYASWTFRKAKKFFDVVTYTGTGADPRTISHNLGSVPGSIIVKRTDSADDWIVYHRSVTTGYLKLNTTDATQTRTDYIYQNPTSTTFQVGGSAPVNASGGTYVAYLFAHDAGGFGDDGDESVIKCGSYTAAYPNSPVIDLGWEPQWILIKRTDQAGSWLLFDTMRGMAVSDTGGALLYANSSNQEQVGADWVIPTATGFIVDPRKQGYALVNPDSSATFIYIAIRRGPMKTPTDATEVFNVDATTSSSGRNTVNVGFSPDHLWQKSRLVTSEFYNSSRLTGSSYLDTNSTAAEAAGFFYWDDNTTFFGQGMTGASRISYLFRRAPGFFDVVAWTGSATSTGEARYIDHNLAAPVYLIIIKNRSSGVWMAQVPPPLSGNNYHNTLNLNNGNSAFYDIANLSGSSNFLVTTYSFAGYQPYNTNTNGQNYIAYLFGSLPGVSKVGKYTGTGTTQDIDCGFTSGARFVLIKRLDPVVALSSTPPPFVGDWYVWDTARGIVSGNDPYLLLNSSGAETTNTDYIDPLASGFQITSSAPPAINASGGSYIFLAIA